MSHPRGRYTLLCASILTWTALACGPARGASAGSSNPPLTILNSQFAASVSWGIDPDTGGDVLRGYVQYTPVASEPSCSSIRFIQAARVEVSDGVDYQWAFGQQNRNLMRTGADATHHVQPGYFIDHDASKCEKGNSCSPYFLDSWPTADPSEPIHDGSFVGGKAVLAQLLDFTFGWSDLQRMSLEACAQCVDSGTYYGCVTWGGNWPEIGDRQILASKFEAAPSPTFLAALAAFKQFYGQK